MLVIRSAKAHRVHNNPPMGLGREWLTLATLA